MEKKPILFLENIDKAFKTSDGDFYALKNINLSFPNKGLHCLVGKSGSGKSTLLNLLLQIEKPTKGEIFYKNKKISKYKIYQYTKDGELIKVWDYINDIIKENPTYKKHSIYAVCSGEKPTMYGYKWVKVLNDNIVQTELKDSD